MLVRGIGYDAGVLYEKDFEAFSAGSRMLSRRFRFPSRYACCNTKHIRVSRTGSSPRHSARSAHVRSSARGRRRGGPSR